MRPAIWTTASIGYMPHSWAKEGGREAAVGLSLSAPFGGAAPNPTPPARLSSNAATDANRSTCDGRRSMARVKDRARQRLITASVGDRERGPRRTELQLSSPQTPHSAVAWSACVSAATVKAGVLTLGCHVEVIVALGKEGVAPFRERGDDLGPPLLRPPPSLPPPPPLRVPLSLFFSSSFSNSRPQPQLDYFLGETHPRTSRDPDPVLPASHAPPYARTNERGTPPTPVPCPLSSVSDQPTK